MRQELLQDIETEVHIEIYRHNEKMYDLLDKFQEQGGTLDEFKAMQQFPEVD